MTLEKVRAALEFYAQIDIEKYVKITGIEVDCRPIFGYKVEYHADDVRGDAKEALTELNAYIARLESLEFKKALALEILNVIEEAQCSTNA